jgi:hypothetical protein
MNQEQLLAQRDELVREDHLGELELYCTPKKSKERAKFTAGVSAMVLGFSLVLFVIVALFLILSGQTLDLSLFSLPAFLILVAICIWYVLSLFTNRTSVYVYTNGLVCLRRSGGRVVHWEEIRKVEIYWDSEGFDTLFVELNDNTRIQFPESRSQGSASNEALRKFIEEKMALTDRASEDTVLASEDTVSASPLSVASPALLAGRYLIIDTVGKGGFGAVYKVEDVQRNDSLVAIKSINLSGLSPQEMIEATDTLNREARLLSGLTHPNLPRVYEHFTDGENGYLTMDFIEGETLEEYLNRTEDGYLPVEEVLEIGVQLCDVLDYLYTRQPPIIFHNVKPANIMRTPGGQLYLINFGIARHFTPGQAGDTNAPGTPEYAAPEQDSRVQTTVQSDIYSLGATLRYLLTGKDLSESTSSNAAPDVQDQQAPTLLEHFLMQMLELDADKRPESMKVVKRVLLQMQLAGLLNEREALRKISILGEP